MSGNLGGSDCRCPLTRTRCARRPLPARGRGDGRVLAWRRRPLRDQPQPQILRHVGVLVLVHQDELEALLVLPQHLRVARGTAGCISSSRSPKSAALSIFSRSWIRRIELLAAAVGERRRLAGRHLVGRQPAVLPVVDQPGQHARRPALLVDALGLQQLLEQPDLVVDVEDGEVALQARPARRGGAGSSRRWRGRCRARACPRPPGRPCRRRAPSSRAPPCW